LPSALGLGKKMTGAGFFFFDLLTLNRNFCNLNFTLLNTNLKALKMFDQFSRKKFFFIRGFYRDLLLQNVEQEL
jgi:hypothetical protein